MSSMHEVSVDAVQATFQREEEEWFESKARGLMRRPSHAPPSMPPSSNIDDSIFDRWASVVPLPT